MTESNRITNELLIEIPRRWPQVRVWRSNSGAGIGMSEAKRAVGAILAGDLKHAVDLLQRPVKFGLIGMADISGIFPVSKFLQIEVKAGKDQQSEQQRNWQTACEKVGVPYLIARNTKETMKELESIIQ